MRRSSAWRAARSTRSRSNVSSVEIEIRSASSSRSRGSIPRARSRSSRPDLARGARRAARRPRATASPPIVAMPAAASRSSARGPTPGRTRVGERREEPGLPSRGHDRDPARLAAVRGDLAHDLRRRDAERARQRRGAADRDLHRLRQASRARRTTSSTAAEVEVALVEPGALDARHDLADRRPDGLRVLPVERCGAVGRRRPPGSGAAPRPRSSPSGSRTARAT